ncbi:MAG: glycoside hydrolase family 38 C-terminal domain-containing protein [Anaerolineales bacterium]
MRNLFVISHTHWDREWYLPFQLFRLKLVHLVDGMLDILEHDKEFKYFMLDGQTVLLDDYLQMRPEKESILRDHIRKGRIVIGPWHILPDMFLVGPEAHIRNLQQGDRTARKFGPKMKIGYMPDSFGHIGQVPQILRGFGIEVASLWRGVEDGPAEFWWQAPDGSRVLMAYLREGYVNGADLPADNLEQFTRMLDEKGNALAGFSATSDLLIMYGTDHMEPPRHTSEAIAYADEMLHDTHVIHSTLQQYATAMTAAIQKQNVELPTIVGELRACKRIHLLPGVLSTRIWIKQRNHACETLLTKWAEPYTTWQEMIDDQASATLTRKTGILNQTWRLLMENHPHDSICGCSVDQVHQEMRVRFDQVEQVGEEITRQALESLARCVATDREIPSTDPLPVTSIVIFNPSSFSRTDCVSAVLELPPNLTEFDLVDEQGNHLPYQERGLGSHEIINLDLDTRGLQSAFGNISDGRAAGMTIQDIKVRRQGAEVFIETVMANGGEPNLTVWNANRKQIEGCFADSTVTIYHVRARSTSAAQIVTTVTNVPAHGYRTFWIIPRTPESKPPIRLGFLASLLLPLARLPFVQKLATRKRYARPPYKIEIDLFAVEALKDGTLTILDKQTQLVYRGLNHFLDGGDCGDEYNYCPPTADRVAPARLKRVTLVRGPVQQSLELELELTTSLSLALDRKSRSVEKVTSPITTTITLTNGVPRIDVRTRVDNRARDHRLRVHFPAPFAAEKGSHDGHFEVVERKIGIPLFDESWVEQPRPEVPQRAFTSVSDGKSGLTIANRGLTEVEALKNSSGNAEIALTLLRCVGWLSRDDFPTRKGLAGPHVETPGAQMPGIWTFDYSIIPHPGDWRNSFAQAYSFETPMRLARTGLHPGSLPVAGSFVKVTPASFIISAIIKNEYTDGWLLRGYNLTSESIQVTLKPWKLFKKVEKVNLAEEKQASLKSGEDGSITFPVRGHEIVSVLFRN